MEILMDGLARAWLGFLAQLIPLSAAIWALLWFVKDVIALRWPRWHDRRFGRLTLRGLALALGVASACALWASGMAPWTGLPLVAALGMGILTGAGSEVVYRWFGRTLEHAARSAWSRLGVAPPEEGP